MIKSIRPLTLGEARDLLSKKEDNDKAKEVLSYTKKFTKLSSNEIKELRVEIEKLGLLKLREDNITKIIDMLPADTEDVRKILTDLSLEENEITKILEITKKYL